jgi:hypothetical protein
LPESNFNSIFLFNHSTKFEDDFSESNKLMG